jgi:hypothetical protein
VRACGQRIRFVQLANEEICIQDDYMKTLDHLPVLIPSARRNEWKECLCNSSKNASCTRKECVQWDSGYNSADNEPLNSRREKDQENYFAWMNEFCEHLDPEVEETLLLLHLPVSSRRVHESVYGSPGTLRDFTSIS